MNPNEDQAGRSKILIVDDHPLVREGLKLLINQERDLTVCGEVGGCAEALDVVNRLQPDAAIVDLSLGAESGLDLVKRLQGLPQAPRVLVLSMHDEAIYAERSLRAGALGYMMKRESSGRIVAALREVLRGSLVVSPAVASHAAERFLRNGAPSSPIDCLTDREIDVFRRIGHGEENRQIADTLHLSLKTVQTHCAHIKEKLGYENAAVLMREAVKWVESQV
ncbi:MAG TPA: response regulator transcription factor [Opitutaceae bacterium]